MLLNRRNFLILSAGFAAECSSTPEGTVSAASDERVINAGPASDYAADGVYTRFQPQGIFIVRKGEKLFALSAICTHRNCKLTAKPDSSFFCKCHGSAFDPAGHVKTGPAARDLPEYPASTDEKGELLVKVS
jgi:Rieske Fe-S protein